MVFRGLTLIMFAALLRVDRSGTTLLIPGFVMRILLFVDFGIGMIRGW